MNTAARTVTVVGGGLGGLIAATTCAEAGAPVRLLEAQSRLGGRARSTTGEYRANLGPHVVYADGPLWAWLDERGLTAGANRAPLRGLRFRHRGTVRRTPPRAFLDLHRLVRRPAPVDADWRTWVLGRFGPATADIAAAACGVFAFDADPGRLSAEFARERLARVLSLPPAARYMPGGWTTLVERVAAHARAVGVEIELRARVDELPEPPVVVATELHSARVLLADDGLRWEGARTALLDVGVEARRGDPFIVWDLDEAGWAERFSAADPSLAPPGHSLLQAQIGLRPGETLEEGVERLELLLDGGWPGWRDRTAWRRRAVVDGRSGALDLPGHTWRDRPRVERGDGVFLCGDMVAAPGLLGEVSCTSAQAAARGALAHLAASRPRGSQPVSRS